MVNFKVVSRLTVASVLALSLAGCVGGQKIKASPVFVCVELKQYSRAEQNRWRMNWRLMPGRYPPWRPPLTTTAACGLRSVQSAARDRDSPVTVAAADQR